MSERFRSRRPHRFGTACTLYVAPHTEYQVHWIGALAETFTLSGIDSVPELPEVETMRRGIASIAGSRIVGVQRLRCQRRPIAVEPRNLARRVEGRRVEDVGRLGKRVVLRLEGDARLIFEPRMTGLVLVADPPTQEHLRLRLDLKGGPIPHVWYWDRRGLGSVRLLTESEYLQRLGTGHLGPDALGISLADLRARLGCSRRAIKVALLDQRAVAGIGNLYASEILHQAEVHPAKRCDLLGESQWQAIHERMLAILNLAIRYEGSTLGDGTYRNALNQSGGYQNHHRVYDRAGEPCRQCGHGQIVRIVQAQRATFFCPVCQTKGKPKQSPPSVPSFPSVPKPRGAS